MCFPLTSLLRGRQLPDFEWIEFNLIDDASVFGHCNIVRVLESLPVRVEGVFHLSAHNVDDVALGPLASDHTERFGAAHGEDLAA